MNDDQLDIYFKKAQEELSTPTPISDIRERVNASKGGGVGKFRMQRRLQILFVLALAILGFYFIDTYRVNNAAVVIEEDTNNESENTPTEEFQNEEPVPSKQTEVESNSEEATQEVVDVNQPKKLVEEVLPTPEDKATSSVQPEGDPKQTENADAEPELTDNSQPADVPTDKETNPAPETKPEVKPAVKPEPKPEPRDPAKRTNHEFAILSEFTKSDFRKLKKDLAAYGVTLNVDALEYDREFISKIKGNFASTKRKTPFTVKSKNFEKIIVTFQYSINTGPERIAVTSE